MKSAKTLTVPSGILSNIGKSCVWIRTSAGPQMGFGHLKRTMNLARLLNDCTMPLFLIDPQDRWSRQQLADQGMAFIYEPMGSVWKHIPDPKAILVDTRNVAGLDTLIDEARKRDIPVISIHDLGLSPVYSDISIDGSIFPDFTNFPNSNAAFYSGTEYMVLDPIYRLMHQQEKFIDERIHTVFINLGGGNSGRYFEKVLEGLKLWDRNLEIIGAPGYVSWGQESFARKNWGPLEFRWSREPVAPYCLKADLAITAGGLAAYEALCTGTPIVALAYDRYQQTAIRKISQKGACIDLGIGQEFEPSSLPRILSDIDPDREKRREFSTKGRSIVDGRGAERVAQIVRNAIGAHSNFSLLEGVG
jgi:spore coat polysaccharide biosynthesis predicted glycosyltransferase SpsG